MLRRVGQLSGRDAGRVDHQGSAVTEVDHIRGVAEPFVHELAMCALMPSLHDDVQAIYLSVGVPTEMFKC